MIDLDRLESALRAELEQLDKRGANVKIVRFGDSGIGIPGLRLDLEWPEMLARLTYWTETRECLLEKLGAISAASAERRIDVVSLEDIKRGLLDFVNQRLNPW